MKVLITGGAGYVGWSLINNLIQWPEVRTVVIYDNFSRRNYGLLLTGKSEHYRKLSVVADDILNSRGLTSAMESCDCVCHLAALAPSPFVDENPHAFDQVNHWGTAETCYAVEDCDVSRVVYVSSGAVYGFRSEPSTVDDIPMPGSSYGASKLAGERHVQRLAQSRETAIIRAATVYGINPVARFDTFLNKFALDIVLGRPMQVHGSGEQKRAVIHVESLVDIISMAILGRLEGGLYNAVDENISINEAVAALRAVAPGYDAVFMNQLQRLGDLTMANDERLTTLDIRRRGVASEVELMLPQISLS